MAFARLNNLLMYLCKGSVLAASVLSGLWQCLVLMVQGFVSLVDVTSIMKYTGIIRVIYSISVGGEKQLYGKLQGNI